MKQSRRMSLFESITNVVIGYLLSLITQVVVFPIFQIEVSLADNMAISVIFTVVSLVRSSGTHPRQRQHHAVQGVPGRHPGADRRQLGGRAALDDRAVPVP